MRFKHHGVRYRPQQVNWNVPLAKALWGNTPLAEIAEKTGARENQLTCYAYQHSWGRRTKKPDITALRWRCVCGRLNEDTMVCASCGRKR